MRKYRVVTETGLLGRYGSSVGAEYAVDVLREELGRPVWVETRCEQHGWQRAPWGACDVCEQAAFEEASEQTLEALPYEP